MIRKPSPNAVRDAVHRDVWEAVDLAAYLAVEDSVDQAVSGSVAVDMAVDMDVHWVVSGAVRRQPPHPNLQRFIGEVRQVRWSAPWTES